MDRPVSSESSRMVGRLRRSDRFGTIGMLNDSPPFLYAHRSSSAPLAGLARRGLAARAPSRRCLDGDVVCGSSTRSRSALDLAAQRVDARIAALDEVGIDRAVVSLSTPVGIEALPAAEAAPLLDAYHEGVADAVGRAGGRLAAFAAVPLDAAGRRRGLGRRC